MRRRHLHEAGIAYLTLHWGYRSTRSLGGQNEVGTCRGLVVAPRVTRQPLRVKHGVHSVPAGLIRATGSVDPEVTHLLVLDMTTKNVYLVGNRPGRQVCLHMKRNLLLSHAGHAPIVSVPTRIRQERAALELLRAAGYVSAPGNDPKTGTVPLNGETVPVQVRVLHTMAKKGAGVQFTTAAEGATLVYVVNTGQVYFEPACGEAKRVFRSLKKMQTFATI